MKNKNYFVVVAVAAAVVVIVAEIQIVVVMSVALHYCYLYLSQLDIVQMMSMEKLKENYNVIFFGFSVFFSLIYLNKQ